MADDERDGQDGRAALNAALARLEAAIAATEAAASAQADRPEPEDLTPRLEAAEAALAEERARADALEGELAEARAAIEAAEARAAAAAEEGAEGARMRAALDTIARTQDGLRAGADGAADASLRAEVEALRAARAMDLSEMRAILAELEPMVEARHA